MASQTQASIPGLQSVGKEKKKSYRDPEKRRQQNIQAQKKYREKLRIRLGKLEALAATVQNPTIEVSLAAGQSKPTETHGSSGRLASTNSQILAESYSPSGFISALCTTPAAVQYPTPQSDDNSSALTSWDPTTHVDPSLLVYDRCSSQHGPYKVSTIVCGCSVPHIQVQTHGPDPFRYGGVKIFNLGAPAPDPYANNLRIEIVCLTAALYALGTYIGVNEEMICADKSLSPFFRPSIDETTQSSSVSTVQKIFKTLKPDLRPISEQITVDHHPYIDLLPFPTLRKNLIIHQEEVDEEEVFDDILTGLVCWGGTGVGMRDRSESTGIASTGTPWDARSWEGKAWFLKKYWKLLGGEDGELVRQSEWWRSMRGEDALDLGGES